MKSKKILSISLTKNSKKLANLKKFSRVFQRFQSRGHLVSWAEVSGSAPKFPIVDGLMLLLIIGQNID